MEGGELVVEYQQYVDDKFKQQALKKLRKRIKKGEKVEDILSPCTDTYFIDKIVNGLVPMSYEVYDRIMKCTEEDTSNS